MDKTIEILSSKDLERIGVGFCGSVWSAPNTTHSPAQGQELLPFCIKREEGGPFRSLLNEKDWQTQLDEKIAKLSEKSFLVPRCYGYLSKDDTAVWGKLLRRFPPTYEACNAMISNTIQPIPSTVRKDVIRRYCPSESQEQVTECDTNQHCLLRLYLGRRRQPSHSGHDRRPFTLRNLPLHLDQIEEMRLPAKEYARAMARGLAFLNWAVGTDGNDVEFVLAPPRQQPSQESVKPQTWDSPIISKHSLWLLDFDCCRELTLRDCVEQIARSFWRNDPYFPRPGCESAQEQGLWRDFREEYERASIEMMPVGPFGLKLKALIIEPESLINLVVRKIEDSREHFAKG